MPGLVLCEKSEGTLIVFQQDAAGAQDIAHGGVIQIQLQQGADALQPVHQRVAVDEKLPGRGMEVLLLQQVDAQGVQQGGAVGLVVLLQAAQHGVDEGPEVGALGDGADKHVLVQGRGAAAARTAVQVPGGGGGFLIEAPHGAQLQQRGKRHAQDHGLVHAQAHLLQFLQQLFRLGSVPGAGQQKQEGGFGLHEPPFRPLVGQQSLLIRAGEPVRLRQRDAGQIEVRGRFQRRKAVQLFLHGALLGLGATNILGAFFGFLPTSTYGQNVGIVTTTRVINRHVLGMAAIIILIAGLFPKFSALLTTIPYAVLGGATVSVFASIAMTGIKLALSEGTSPRNTAIIGLAVAMGMGLSAAPATLALFPAWVTTIFGKAPVVAASLIAITLNLLIPKEIK